MSVALLRFGLSQPNSWFDDSGATPPFTNTINRAILEVFYRLKH